MLTVQFKFETDALLVSCKGHAGQAEHGKDIVCSAASILVQTLYHYVWESYELGKLRCEPITGIRSGYAIVECKPNKEHIKEIRSTFRYCRIGYELLQERYPEYVKIKENVPE